MASNITENVTFDFENQKIPKPFVVMMRAQGTVIVLMNFIVLVTLATK